MNILRFIERLNPEHRKPAADDFSRDVLKRFREIPEAELVANPHAALMKIAQQERLKHPFHWLGFLRYSRKPRQVGKFEKQLQDLEHRS